MKSQGNSGGIRISTKSISLADSAQLNASTFGQGNAGNIFVQTSDRVSLSGKNTAIFSSLGTPINNVVNKKAEGNGGEILIEAKNLSLVDGSQIFTSSFARGNAGNIFVRIDESVSLLGGSTISPDPIDSTVPYGVGKEGFKAGMLSSSGASTGIFSTIEPFAKGNAGNINIQARSVTLNNGAQVQSLTRGKGKAGNIIVRASDSINLSGVASSEFLVKKSFFKEDKLLVGGFSSGFVTATEGESSEQGGDIQITTKNLHLSDGAVLNARTRSDFRGGDINIKANTLELFGGGQILTSAFRSGSTGNINIDANESIHVSGTDLTLAARLEKFGETIVDNDGSNSGLFARVRGNQTANAGKIEINANSINLDRQGTITTETTLGEGGDIIIDVGNILLLQGNSNITATAGTAQKGGNGGSITINAPNGFIVAVPKENSDITANAFTGKGGEAKINSQGVFGIETRSQQTDKNDITATSEQGIQGVTTINAPDNSSIQNNLIDLPSNQIDTNALIANSCITLSTKRQENSFTITGSGGLPNSPVDGFVSKFSTGDVRNVEQVSRNWKKGDEIVEPTGAYRLADGRLILGRVCK